MFSSRTTEHLLVSNDEPSLLPSSSQIFALQLSSSIYQTLNPSSSDASSFIIDLESVKHSLDTLLDRRLLKAHQSTEVVTQDYMPHGCLFEAKV